MRLSQLLDSTVVDAAGEPIGVVRDVRATFERNDQLASHFSVTGIVIGQPGRRDKAAHVWGFAEGRATGPWLLERMLRRATSRSLFVSWDEVASWDPQRIVLTPAAAPRPLAKEQT